MSPRLRLGLVRAVLVVARVPPRARAWGSLGTPRTSPQREQRGSNPTSPERERRVQGSVSDTTQRPAEY